MKYLCLIAFASLSACTTIEEYYTDTSPETCYGLGTPQCVEEGYRDSVEMRPTMTVYERNHTEKAFTEQDSQY